MNVYYLIYKYKHYCLFIFTYIYLNGKFLLIFIQVKNYCCYFLSQGDSVQAVDDSPFSDSVTLEQTTSNIGGSSGRVSLWMQWVLPKITVKLFAPDPDNKGIGIGLLFYSTDKILNTVFRRNWRPCFI